VRIILELLRIYIMAVAAGASARAAVAAFGKTLVGLALITSLVFWGLGIACLAGFLWLRDYCGDAGAAAVVAAICAVIVGGVLVFLDLRARRAPASPTPGMALAGLALDLLAGPRKR
jgi:hypothetical protein